MILWSFTRLRCLFLNAEIVIDISYVLIVSKVMLKTVVEGDLKAPFLIATTPRCRRWRYSLPWIVPLYLWSVPKQGGIKYHFLSLLYDSNWNWTYVSTAISEHSNYYANVLKIWREKLYLPAQK